MTLKSGWQVEAEKLEVENKVLRDRLLFDKEFAKATSFSSRYLAKKLVELSGRSFESWMVESVKAHRKEDSKTDPKTNE